MQGLQPMWFHLDTSTSIMQQEQTWLCCSHVMGRELLTCQAGHWGVNHTKNPQSEPSPEKSKNKRQQTPWNILNQPGLINRLQTLLFFTSV